MSEESEIPPETEASNGADSGKKTISFMSSTISRQISTAQVITSAAGAVRQLLDNAVDAGAKCIEILTDNYGLDSIRVSDDGTGIEEASFDSLCKPHATSKLTDYSDLLSLSTLGFRGEALNAMCMLGSVTITTRTKSSVAASRLHFSHSGEITKTDVLPREPGTTVEVRQLFSSLPVRRREFERTAKKDYAKLLAVVQEFALSRPNISFNVYSNVPNGKRHHALVTAGGLSSLSDVISNLFGGREEKAAMIQVESVDTVDDALKEQYGIRGEEEEGWLRKVWMTGYSSSPEHGQGRSTLDRQFVFVNGRPVDYPKLCRSANELYQQYNRRQVPALVLKVDMPPEWIDVNVTPDKRLVFCQKEKVLLCCLRAALQSAYKPFEGLLGSLDSSTVKVEPLSSSFNSSVREKRKKENSFRKVGGKRGRILNESEDDESREEREGSSMMDRSGMSTTSEDTGDVLRGLDDDDFEERRRGINGPGTSSGWRGGGGGGDTVGGRGLDTVIQTHKPAGFRSRNLCIPTATRAQSTATTGHRTLESFAFKLIPHRSTSAAVADTRPVPATDELRDRPGLDRGLLTKLAARSQNEQRLEEQEWSTVAAAARNTTEPPVEEFRAIGTAAVKHEVLSQSAIKREVASQRSQRERMEEEKGGREEREEEEGRERTENEERQTGREEDDNGRYEVEEDDDDGEFTLSQCLALANDPDEDRSEQPMDITLEDILGVRAERRLQREEDETEQTAALDCLQRDVDVSEEAENELRSALKRSDFEKMEVIGQFNDGFIITRLLNHLFIVDQHASDEKRNYERLEKRAMVKTQTQVNPQRLDAGAVQESIVRDNLHIFQASGFDFDFAEDGCARLTSVPLLHSVSFDRADVDELISLLEQNPGVMHRPAKLKRVFASKACRSSVMIGSRLDREKMEEIVKGLGELNNPWSCPHGRPTLRHLMKM